MTEFQFDMMKSALTELNLPEVTHLACLTILDDKRTKDIFTAKNTRNVIAGAIYITAIQTNNRVTQRQIADVVGVSKSTIYTYYVRMAKLLGLYG
ncbi:MAG: winged helix-turn-helix transcriptional regulator [Candidatus Thorarchaeota archaeon]|nr:winged helix-turn-helix transcriptional regulator [Candidatus Thorarchaeota archaeon]